MFQPIEENVSVYKKVVAQIQEMIMHGELKKVTGFRRSAS